MKRLLTLFALVFALTPALAQPQPPTRIRGTIAAVDGAILVVKTAESGEARLRLADALTVFGVAKATLDDIKPNAFIGVGASPQADGSQKAIQVTIFAESQRGTGEGHRPWDRPNTTMTNATVDDTVAGVDGRIVTVRYRDGEKKIVIGPDAVIRAFVIGDRAELKPGAAISTFAFGRGDGTFDVTRISVGRDGVVP